MKKFFPLLTFCFFTMLAYAQNNRAERTIPTSYDRSSLTVLYFDMSSGSNWEIAKTKIDSLIFSDKFDNNNLEELIVKPSFAKSGIPRGTQVDAILEELNTKDLAKKIVSIWYNRQQDGTMDMETVHQRGRFSATDADYFRASATRRGESALRDFGSRLIDLSHILVINLDNIRTAQESGLRNMKGWQGSSNGYLYKIDFNDEVRAAFYDTWVYDDDTEDVKRKKIKAFEELEIPIKPVVDVSVRVTALQPESDSGLGLFFRSKSTDELMHELVQKSLDEVVYRLESEVESFQVVTPLYETRPLKAKIGLKEGLKADNRFFVYEYVYNSRTNDTEPVRRGVVRAHSRRHIVDNRYDAMGETEASRFYQVHGRRLQPGFTLQQKNDFGLEISLGAEVGGIGGFYTRADYRLGRHVGVKAFFVYGELGFDGGPGTVLFATNDFTFVRYGAGIAKGMQLGRNMELRPYIGLGIENASNDQYAGDDAFEALYIKPGVNLALNLSYRLQIIGGIGSYIIGSGTNDSGTFVDWENAFGRSGPSALIGIKFGL